MKSFICTITGAVGSFICYLFGGWDTAMATLLIFMILDYITGLMVAGIFKKSTKTRNGALDSKAGFKGLCKKCMVFIFVIIGYQLDYVTGLDYIRNMVIIAFITNELISIIENAGLMGVPVPKVITNAIEVLKKNGGEEDD